MQKYIARASRALLPRDHQTQCQRLQNTRQQIRYRQRAANDRRYQVTSDRAGHSPFMPVTAEQHSQDARQHLSLAIAAYGTALGILARRALRWVLWRLGIATALLGGLWVSYAAPATG